MNRTVRLASCMVALGFLACGAATNAAEVTVKVAISSSGDHMFVHMSNVMAEEVEKRVPGRVDWQLFEGGQLGGDGVATNGLRQGTHIMTMNGSWFQNVEPSFGIFDAPFLITNREEARKVIRAIEDDLAKAILDKGIVLVGIGELGFRQISNNVRPIVQPADLQGIKLRTPGNPFRIAMFKSYGANPTPISGDEVYMALRQGVVDGQENPLASIWGFKWYEVQEYISMSNHVFTPTFVGISKMHWDTWPSEIQQAIREAANAAAEYSFKLGEEKDNTLKEQMKKQNPNLKFNDIDVAAFKRASEPLSGEMEKMVGREIWIKATNALQ